MISKKDFCVIGLGRFGRAAVDELSKLRKNVVAIDIKEEKTKLSSHPNVEYKILDSTNVNSMNAIDIKNFDVAIVAIGDNIEASILTTSFLIEIGIKLVITRAKGRRHKKILQQLGAHLVLTPEANSGKNAALHAVHNIPIDFQPMTKQHSIFKVKVTNPEIISQTIKELRISKLVNFNILLIERGKYLTILADGETELMLNDSLIILVKNKYISDVTNFIDPTTIKDKNRNNILKKLKAKKITF